MTELIAFQVQCKWSCAILPSSEDDWRDLSFRESVNVFACSAVCAGVCVCACADEQSVPYFPLF